MGVNLFLIKNCHQYRRRKKRREKKNEAVKGDEVRGDEKKKVK